MNKNNYIIAIDGGAGVGKTSISKELAKRLNIIYIDTGAMYRAVALYFLINDIQITDENIQKYINNIDLDIKIENGNNIIILNNKDVTNSIRDENVSMAASLISKSKIVRDILVDKQRNIALNRSVVIEGRDTTTVVFPNADLKIYLTASLDVRAKRRHDDLAKLNKTSNITIENVKENMIKRDEQDTTRKESPLIVAEDAIKVDTSNNDVDKSVNIIISLLKQKVKDINV